MSDELLTADEVAARLKISRRAAYDLIRRLVHIRIGRSIRLPEASLRRFLRQGGDPGYYDRVASDDG